MILYAAGARPGLAATGGALPELRRLERFDVLEAIHDPAADLEEARRLTETAPTLQGARRQLPSACKLYLVEMTADRHASAPTAVIARRIVVG